MSIKCKYAILLHPCTAILILQLTDNEHKALVSAFSDPTGIQASGLHINKVKHFALASNERSIYGKMVSRELYNNSY